MIFITNFENRKKREHNNSKIQSQKFIAVTIYLKKKNTLYIKSVHAHITIIAAKTE